MISCVHQLAQNAAGSALPYLGIQILKLGAGQQLNQHRDCHNHPDYPNHTMKFGSYKGGSLQMLRYGTWHSYDSDCQWLSFDALRFVHRVQPVTSGARYSITLYTPGKLEHLTAQDWDLLAKAGFPIYLYEPLPARMRRLMTPSHVMQLIPEAKKTQFGTQSRVESRKQYHHRSHDALLSYFLENDEHLWEDIPLPSVADPEDENLLKPKTLLEHCKDAQEYMDEFDLNDGYDNQTLKIMRIHGNMTRMIGYFQAMLYHAESNDRHGYLWTLKNMFRLLFIMANEAELTHPKGRFALYDGQRGEIARSDTWKPPDFLSLIHATSTEHGKSEFSCVLDDTTSVVMARPMVFSDETRPTDYTFANKVAVHVQTNQSEGSTPDELARTIQSHLWLANLEISSGIAPAMSTTSQMHREPHPNGPTTMTWHQLADAHKTILQGNSDRNVSLMLKGVVANMHMLAKLSREAGFLPYIGHAHYIYQCYLKSQINSSRPPSGCDLSTVWSLQGDLDKDLPKACSLALKPLWMRHPNPVCC